VYVEVAEVVFQGFLVAFAALALLGVLDLTDPLPVVVRTILVQVVPLAFGASLANELLSGDQEEISEASFPASLGVFALGAVFFAAPIAPTNEVATGRRGQLAEDRRDSAHLAGRDVSDPL